MLLSAAVISVVGWFLLQQTRDGLLDHRVDAVVAEANDETEAARKLLSSAPGTDSDAVSQQQALAATIIQRGETRGFSAVLFGPAVSGRPDRRRWRQLHAAASTPPASRRRSRSTSTTSSETAWTYTTIRTTVDRRGRPRSSPGIAVGSQVQLPADSQTYTLYYLFPLSEQEETLALVTRALLTAGALLLVLVAGMTWLVTRQVVTPIRMARRVAERLAAGQLQERLKVSGEDDLARLATSFNQMASNLQRQIRQLEELSRVQRRFVSDVSHELRTPLTTVRMAADVLHDARTDFDPTTARAAELLQTELDRFETLLVDLLEISRFDAGAAVLELDDVNLVDVAHRIVDATRPLAEQRHVTVAVEAPDHPCLAEADVRRVERIVRNLVTNAIDHTATDRRRGRASSCTSAATRAPPRSPSATTASGWRPARPSMVFNRFWRADPARARTSGGTGLGTVDRARGHPPARRLAAGVGSTRRGRAVPADPAAPRRAACCGTARSRWCRST